MQHIGPYPTLVCPHEAAPSQTRPVPQAMGSVGKPRGLAVPRAEGALVDAHARVHAKRQRDAELRARDEHVGERPLEPLRRELAERSVEVPGR